MIVLCPKIFGHNGQEETGRKMKNKKMGGAAVGAGGKVLKFLKKNSIGYLFIMPVLIGMAWFTFYPMISSFIFSFLEYDMINPAKFIGLKNYIRAFTLDWDEVGNSLGVTAIYAVASITIDIVLSFLLAVALNRKVRGIRLLRTLYYLPVLIPAVVSSIIWVNLFDVEFGLANAILNAFGLPSYTWFSDGKSSMITLLFTGLFGLGGSLMLWISALNSIDTQYYEYAETEGANSFVKLIKITIPLCTPTFFYKLITGIIAALQNFTVSYVLSNSRAVTDDSLLFFAVNIYNKAFHQYRMGYASALSWILFVIIAALTLLVFRSQKKWVFYGEDN